MPTYDYLCGSCGRRIEQFQNMKDEPLKSCSECGGSLKRVISGGSGFIMKGGSLCYSSCSQDAACCEGETSSSCGHSGGCGCH